MSEFFKTFFTMIKLKKKKQAKKKEIKKKE